MRLTRSFDKQGRPLFEVSVSAPPDAPGASREVLRLVAMLDTGSDATAIYGSAIQSLNLRPHDSAKVQQLREKTGSEIYKVQLAIPGLRTFACDVLVFEPETRENRPESMLIGCDILRQLVLTYNDPQGTFTLRLPARR